MDRKAKNCAIIFVDELLESSGITLLCSSNQRRVVHPAGTVFKRSCYARQNAEIVRIVGYTPRLIRFRHDVYSLVSYLLNRRNTTSAISSSRCWLPAKFLTEASTEKSTCLGLQPENVLAASTNPSVPNSVPDSFLHSVTPSE